jgi:hypothetical protein
MKEIMELFHIIYLFHMIWLKASVLKAFVLSLRVPRTGRAKKLATSLLAGALYHCLCSQGLHTTVFARRGFTLLIPAWVDSDLFTFRYRTWVPSSTSLGLKEKVERCRTMMKRWR